MATNKNVATPEMMNAIRNSASTAYQDAVPVATLRNLNEVSNPILAYANMANEFLDLLVNKIVATIVYRKMWENPLAILRKQPYELGVDVEELHTNPATSSAYDGTDTGMADLLKVTKPDVAPAWYRLNRQDKYKVTVNDDQLKNAFTSWGALEGFIGSIVDSLYNGCTIDEFAYTKQLVTDAVTGSKMKTITVTKPIDAATSRQFQIALKNLSLQFTFPSTAYNNYKLMGGTGNDRKTWSAISDQVIIISADVASTVGVELLANAFNLEYADYVAKQIIIDEFTGSPNTLAVLCDVKAFQIREKLRKFANFFNPSSLSWQYFYHAWDTFSLSPFHNCVALVTE